jgi:radical SAM superfamily enzyme YgiQ (UPF0313 family)
MFPEALRILVKTKGFSPHAVTIMGGAHMSAYWHRAMEHDVIDFGFRGEAEKSFGLFLNEVENNGTDWASIPGLIYRESGAVKTNEFSLIQNLDELVPIDYRFISLDRYIALGYRLHCPEKMNAPILATRGCPYRCAFCAAPVLNGKHVRTHSPEYIARVVRHLYDEFGIRWFNFVDDNFTFHVAWCKEVCDRLVSLKLKGVGYGTPNGIRFQRGDMALWQKMKLAGWQSVVVAPESGSEATILRMHKDIKLETLPPIIRDMRSCGLIVQGFFIIGYPGEGVEDIQKTVDFIKTCDFDFFYLNNFQPIPGTEIYDELVKSGEIKDMTLPNNYSDGIRVYTPPGLRDFNFSKFVLKTYFWYALVHPRVFIHILKFFNIGLFVKKLTMNALSALKSRKASPSAP